MEESDIPAAIERFNTWLAARPQSKVPRWLRYWWQRRTRGWDDSETWSLNFTIAKFALPRLKRFRELKCCHPGDMTPETWNEALDDMIYALEIHVREGDEVLGPDDCDWDRVQRGIELFGVRFHDLWW